MSLSDLNNETINTIPILSVNSAFTYTFEIPNDNRVQILWSQYTSVTDAVVGTRSHVLQIRDELLNLVLQVNYFATQQASSTALITYAQGSTIIPISVLGRITTIPADGLFVKNNWSMTLFILLISAGDAFAGNFQTRGFHN